MTTTQTTTILLEIQAERVAQDRKWGEQNHPDGTRGYYEGLADDARHEADTAAEDGSLTWRHILAEEFYEALAEKDPVRLREELIQVAAVAAAWIEAIDRRRVCDCTGPWTQTVHQSNAEGHQVGCPRWGLGFDDVPSMFDIPQPEPPEDEWYR